MSLVGSLEDLGLEDILQIVGLSRKSGVLLLRSGGREGRITVLDGQVRAGRVVGEPSGLRDILIEGGFASEEEFKEAEQAAAASGAPLDEAVAERTGLAVERIDSLRRERVEQAVLTMFRWRTGEFSFEVCEDVEGLEPGSLLPGGINAQYLAMEATRLGDEAPGDAGPDEADPEPVFSGEEPAVAADAEPPPTVPAFEEASPDEVADPFAEPDGEPPLLEPDSIEPFEAEGEVAAFDDPDATARVAGLEAGAPAAETAPFGPVAPSDPVERFESVAPAEPFASAPPAAAHEPLRPLVAIDPDLSALEWLKASLDGMFTRIHIFQSAEGGLARVRQYLARAQKPVVLLSTGAVGGAAPFVRRLQSLAPGMPVLVLDDGRGGSGGLAFANGVVERPPTHKLADRRAWPKLEGAAEAVREALQGFAGGQLTASGAAGARATEAEGAERLEAVMARLRDPAARGDVLSLVLDFAAASFSRVAMFMVREGVAVGMAQVGLSKAGGPDDATFREVEVVAEKPGWFRSVFQNRSAHRGPPMNPADRRLSELLGDPIADEAYVAPIQSGGEVAALLYADNLPEGRPLGDTRPLESVLHEAGLALDRALLARAQAEVGDPDA